MINGVLASRGAVDDKALFAAAELRRELLQIGAHPSAEGITQVRNDVLDITMYRPEYHHDFCMHTFGAGIFVMRLLLREVELLGSHEAWWMQTSAKHAGDVISLENTIQPALQEMERRITKQRAIAKQKRQAQKARQRKAL